MQILILTTLLVESVPEAVAFVGIVARSGPKQRKNSLPPLLSDWRDDSQDSNKWSSVDDVYEEKDDWQEVMARKEDGSFWSDFEPSKDTDTKNDINNAAAEVAEIDESEAWLETLASLQAEEVQFNMKEADRADKVRQMQEWGFDLATIQSTLDVAVDTSLEEADEIDGMKMYRQESYWEEDDLSKVESHTRVPIDSETGEPIRSQMVYVDEHTCIGTYDSCDE